MKHGGRRRQRKPRQRVTKRPQARIRKGNVRRKGAPPQQPDAVSAPLRTLAGPIEVQARDIAGLGDSQLREVASRLCKLQTFLQGGDVSKVIFPPEINASDQGGDGTTPENDGKSPWLPAAATCWQLKAGKRAGAPANLKGEVTKALPSQYLRNGASRPATGQDRCSGGRTARRLVQRSPGDLPLGTWKRTACHSRRMGRAGGTPHSFSDVAEHRSAPPSDSGTP